MRGFALGLVEGLAKSTTKGVKDAMDDLDGRLSRLSEKRLARATTEQARYKQDFQGNENDMKSLVAALGKDGEGIMHSLITSNGWNGTKALIPQIVKKMANTNMSASQVLKFKAADGSNAPSIKQLSDLVTIPLNMPDLDMGTSLEGSGSHILNIFTNSEDGIQNYAKKYIQTDMALAGVSNKTTNYGELSASGATTVDRFELGLTNNLKDNLLKINAAVENAAPGSKQQKEYQKRKYILESTINNSQDKILTASGVKSNTAVHSEIFSEFAMVKGDINYLSNTWIPASMQAANTKTAILAAEEATDILQWTKNNRGKNNATAKALVPINIPSGIQGLEGLGGEYISSDRFIKALAHSGYRAIRMERGEDTDADPYITIGDKINFDFDAITKAKNAAGINNNNKAVLPPNKKVFTQGSLTLGASTTKIVDDADIKSAFGKFKFSNNALQKVHAISIKNRLGVIAAGQDYKVLFKDITGQDWKQEYDN